MKSLAATLTAIALAAMFGADPASAGENRIDLVRPDAPALASPGPLAIGVRTIEVVNPDQVDILNVVPEGEVPTYNRPLTLEVWYPATGDEVGGVYEGVKLRDGQTEVSLHGRAVRDAAPATVDGPYPLIIISHGYPGNRFLMSPLAENLATKGYVVVSIDHTDSTYSDQSAFGSTLVNRSLDQTFVLDEMARLNGEAESFLAGLVDAETTGLIGYSMGGYGAIITAGGGVTEASVGYSWGAPAGTLGVHLSGSESHAALPDPRIRAIVAFAPWGREREFWSAETLAGVETPVFFVAGSQDDVSGYEAGVRLMFEETVNADRYLLTFIGANHNAGAPMPAPQESWQPVETLDFVPFEHYADAVWDNVRMNNVSQHFVTAFLGLHLKQDGEMAPFLDLIAVAEDGVYSVDEEGTPQDDHTYWLGFPARTAKGLILNHLTPGE
ncbi:MAG: dienelactone hydrolase [Pseudomonadota bacterium]